MARSFKSYEEFAAAKKGGKVPPLSEGDPFARFHRIGWWSNGEIIDYVDDKGASRPLPTTVFIDSIETAKIRAREGWVPVEFVRDEVLDLLLEYHGGAAKLPGPLCAQLQSRLAERDAAAKKRP